MFVQRVAIDAVPQAAVVDRDTVATLLRELGDTQLKKRLDQSFRELERAQPALAEFVSDELAMLDGAPAQALGYFLFVVVFLAFERTCGGRLTRVSREDLEQALERLLADGEVRSLTCSAGSYSEDAVAAGQPALMALINDECERAKDAVPDVDRLFEALLLEVVALSHAVI